MAAFSKHHHAYVRVQVVCNMHGSHRLVIGLATSPYKSVKQMLIMVMSTPRSSIQISGKSALSSTDSF